MMNEQGHRKRFLDQVCLEVRSKDMHDDIREELSGHLEELIQDRQAQGYPQAESEVWAVAQMGDPRSLGKTLNRVHKPRMNWGLLGAVLFFAALSLVMMLSVDSNPASAMQGWSFFRNQTYYMIIGLILMLGLYFVDFRKLQKLAWPLYIGTLIGIIVLYSGGTTINGVAFLILRVVHFPITLSFLTPFLCIALAGILTGSKESFFASVRYRRWIELLIVAFPLPLLAMFHSLPELISYSLIALTVYVWCTRQWQWALGLASVLVAITAVKAWNTPSFVERFQGAFDPNAHATTSGYMYIQIRDVVRSAGWWGHGFANLPEYLPYPHTDMLPVYLVYCFGWAGGLLLLGMVLWFTARLVKALHLIRDPFGKALVLTLGSTLVIRLLYGLSIMSGKMVLSSIAFPFLSYGGHVIMEFAAVGLLLGIYRRKDMMPTAPFHPIK
ncbi:FtsW/RodA/SpoVE family cell cycle protein [Paenibacillus sp. NPDC056722]|uniref:FtsW/RodA/SpoVE family cell cycle protein n=1 Tax=Paenibacillus sp. NPDC056722 TaxID=3345924 RepID=UPI0036C95494